MSKKLEIMHKQTITNIDFLNNLNPIVQTFIKYNNILTSERQWLQIFKIISISVEIEIEGIIEYCKQSSNQTSLDVLNHKLMVMKVLGLIIITWIRLGKIMDNQSSHSQNDKIKVFCTINSQGTQINKPIIVQIRSQEKLKKDQMCRILYGMFKKICKRHLFQLQRIQKGNKIYFKGENLRYEDLSIPFALQFYLSRDQTANKMTKSNDQLQDMNKCLSLSQYVKFIKYFDKITSLGVISLQNFFDLYCRKIQQLIEISHKKSEYYFMLSPKNILVIESRKGKQLDFYFNLKSHFLQVQNKMILPAGADQFMYFDKSFCQHKILYDMELWSVGLSILAVLAEWQSLQYFEKHYQAIEKKGHSTSFIKKQVQKLQQNRDIATYFNINKLKTWLKISKINQTKKITTKLNNLSNPRSDPKAKSEEDKWQKYLKKIKNTHQVSRDQVQKIFGIKITQQKMRSYKQKLFNDKNTYIYLGYQNKELVKYSVSRCLKCFSNRQTMSGSCEHNYCFTCYRQQIEQKFIFQQYYEFLKCPSSNCDKVLCQQIMQTVLKSQKFSSKYRQKFVNKLMGLYVQNNKDSSLRHCLCSHQSSYFQINQNNEMFLCEHCISFICVYCPKKFHGTIDCQHQSMKNGSFQLGIKKRLQGFYYIKQLIDFKVKNSIQDSLFTQFNVVNLRMIQKLQAILAACVAQVQSIKINKAVVTQNVLITRDCQKKPYQSTSTILQNKSEYEHRIVLEWIKQLVLILGSGRI